MYWTVLEAGFKETPNHRKTDTEWYRLYVESKEAELGKAESRMVIVGGLGGVGNGGTSVRGDEVLVLQAEFCRSDLQRGDYS